MLISLMKIDSTRLSKILPNKIQQHIKRLHNMITLILWNGCKDNSIYANQFNICKSINVMQHINKIKSKII
jgi:hypothetical protein